MGWIRYAALLVAILATASSAPDAQARALPDTWDGIHVGLVFDYSVPGSVQASANVDVDVTVVRTAWNSGVNCLVNWKRGLSWEHQGARKT